MDAADRFVDWLANHELVGLALLVGVVAALIIAAGELLATRIPNAPPRQEDEHATERFI